LKTIDVQPQCPVELGELPVRQFSDKPIIADHLPHNLPVLLLYVTLIIAPSWASSGKRNLLVFTKGEQLDIDELRSIIRINAPHGKGQQVLSALEGSNNGLLTFIQERKAFGPAGGNIGEGQGPQERSVGLGGTMSDQVGFQKAWLDVIPLLEGADRNLLLQQRS